MAKKKNAVREDGRICVQVYLGRGEDGKRRYKTVYGATQKEADEKALQVKLAMRKGLDVTAENDTFARWAARWIKIKKGEVSASRYASLAYTSKHLTGTLGHLSIAKVRTADIQGVIADLIAENPTTGKPTSPATLRLVKTIAAQIFRVAVENRVIEYNPADAVHIPPITPVWERRALTTEEQAWIEGTPHRARTAAMVMMHAGLRRGEAIPLLWSDVDLTRRTISVSKAVENVGGHFVLKGSLKTEAGRRVVGIPQKLTDYLATVPKESMYVCCNVGGAMHTPSSFVCLWKSYLETLNLAHGDFSAVKPIKKPEAGKRKKTGRKPKEVPPFVIPHFTPHWLRHTFATNMYHAGVDALAAKKQLGHAKIDTTLGIYTHLDATHEHKAMDKLDAFLSGCKSNASQGNESRQ